ncbi:MAG TPA: EAL domain-containing protein, partial [Rhodocyclaceae bacterium]
LELTESLLLSDVDNVLATVQRLKAIGVKLSIDDFGTGYSSLSYLKRFPIETLKIDRSFIAGTPADTSDCAIAGAIISMAKQLNHRTIAEGVETAEQVEFLRGLGCDEIQGYYYSPPLPSEKFEGMVRAGKPLAAK